MPPDEITTTDSERAREVQRIRAREESSLEGNYRRTMTVLMAKGDGNVTKEPRGISSIIARRSVEAKSFSEKIAEFRQYHDSVTFGTIIHVSTQAMTSSDGDRVILKSPVQLGYSASSGVLDEEIGNTNYVFASANSLGSNSSRGGGGGQYLIESRDCDVVPMDIAHMHPNDFGGSEAKRLEAYANNIYSYPHFVEVFSAYTALLFESQEEAISFFERHWFYPDSADAWDIEQLEISAKENPDDAILLKMAKLYKEDGIVPPISPEFQYRDSVEAISIAIPEYS